MIQGVKFVGIPVRNQDAALAFYTGALGCELVTDAPLTPTQRWIEVRFPGAETGLALFTPEGHENRIGEFQSISFLCEDVFAAAEELKARGVIFVKDPKREAWGGVAIFRDPDGNQLLLSER